MTDAIEVLLLRWADNQQGRTVTFLLPDDDGEHPFRGEKCGAQNGQRYGIALARIADDETREEDTGRRREATQPKKPMSPSQRAAMLCRDEAFQGWIKNHVTGSFDFAAVEDEIDRAKFRMRHHCKVYSRSAFDTDEAARLRFEALETEYLQHTGRMAKEV